MKTRYISFFVLLIVSLSAVSQTQPLRLWYDQPASVWEETLPLGNGRLGMMPDGGVNTEKIVLNDITLWSGAPQDANNYQAWKSLPMIRQLLAAGKNDEAQELINRDFVCTGKGSAGVNFGCFQVFGTLQFDFNYKGLAGKKPVIDHYERELSLDNAIAKSTYTINHVSYTREYFCSFDDDLNMIRLKADEAGQLNFQISISRPERATSTVQRQELLLSGQLDNGIDGKGMQFLSRIKVKLKGGTLRAAKGRLVISNATEAVICLAAGTDFRNPDFRSRIDDVLRRAQQKSYVAQRSRHIRNYQRLFNRVSLSLGQSSGDGLPTNKRLEAYHLHPAQDTALPALFFQFGRYLSISSTRVGLLPPNLQGLWANQVQTPWNGDYHLDVNVQMNHWPLEVVNLSELNLPLGELVKGLVGPGEKTARAYYQAKGWVAHVITNIWGFTAPGESASWGITKAGSGWLCNNLWEHYAFTGDLHYLKDIYPVLRGAAEFYSSILIRDEKTGWLVTSPSSSPENTFYLANGKTASICEGATIDNQMIRELFTHVIQAASQLKLDPDLRKVLEGQLAKLPPPARISGDGRIMEWMEDYKETDPQHRHLSHLYGLYPAALISPSATPELAEAARKTLNVRGDDGPSWTIAYKLLFWARLQDGNRAGKLFADLMKPTLKNNINYGAGGGIYPNLLSAGPPFQIDGNFGATAGIAEMLIQSHSGIIELLPALPDDWKAAGEVKGLRARDNFTVDMKWKNGMITSYRISSAQPRKVKVRLNGQQQEIQAEAL